MRRALLVVVLVATVSIPGGLVKGDAERCSPCVFDLMSAKEFEETGLDTLTPRQLAALSSWLDAYRMAVALEVARSIDEWPFPGQTIETRIDGDFDGWVGDTVFKLQNGQVWQQTNPSAHYLFAHAPRVVISRAPYRMTVDGIATAISVRRLR